MGRAVVVESLGNAFYSVDIIRDSAEVRAFVDIQLAAIQSITDSLPDLLQASNAAETEMDFARQQYEVDQAALEIGETSSYLENYLSTSAAYEVARSSYLSAKIRAVELQNKADEKLAALEPRRADVWCSTYIRLDVGQTVATIEVGHQASKHPYTVIAPLGREPDNDDGVLRDVMSMTPAQAYLNYALLPGATKWRRRYSVATVTDTDLDNEKVLVNIWIFNSAGFYITEDPSALWLPYIRRCVGLDSCEFHVGDRVLVEHHPTTDEPAQVIGWTEWPRACLGLELQSFILVEGWKAGLDSAVGSPDDGDWNVHCARSAWVIDPYYTPDTDVGSIDGIKRLKGLHYSQYPPPTGDLPEDAVSWHQYNKYKSYSSLDAVNANPIVVPQWEAAKYSGEHLKLRCINGEYLQYFRTGDYELIVYQVPQIQTSTPTNFSIVQRLFGDGEIRSIKAEWPAGTDALSISRGDPWGQAYTTYMELGSKSVRLTSDYAYELFEAYIYSKIINYAVEIPWTHQDSKYSNWEEFAQGVRDREVALVATEVSISAAVGVQYEYLGVTITAYEIDDVI